MLRITLEMVPYGQNSRARVLGVMKISNVGGDDVKGNYVVSITDGEPPVEKKFKLNRFLRARRAWALVMECIKKYEKEGKKKQ